MATGIEAHLRDLENDARDAERDIDDFQERAERRIEALNEQVRELVARVQKEKQGFREQLERKRLFAKKKFDEVAAFRATLSGGISSVNSVDVSLYQSSSRPSTYSEQPPRTSLTSLDEPSFASLHQSDHIDLPKVAVKTAPPVQDGVTVSSVMKYLPDHQIICRQPNGSWCEIRCFLCGGNYIDKKGWIRGARGMLAHANKSHKIDTWEGKKLDSTNILEFCTHRQIPDSEVSDIIDNKIQLDAIPCRELGQNGVVSTTPKTTPKLPKTKDSNHTPGHEGEEDDADKPYDWLKKYPTIVMRKDGQWVELRCDICHGNSLANSDKRFAQGVIGFVRHLSRGHGIKPDSSNRRLDWTMKRCEYRLVPEEEIASLTENNGAYPGPAKIPFKQTAVAPTSNNFQDSTGSEFNLLPMKRRLSKQRPDVTEASDDEESDAEVDEGDPDFELSDDKEHNFKKARHSVPFSPKQSLRQSKKGIKGGSASLPTSPTTASKPSNPLESYCPCTVQGHDCLMPECTKTRICPRVTHDESCRHLSHDLKPTCVMKMLGSDCPDGDQCNNGHDMMEQRSAIARHDCKKH